MPERKGDWGKEKRSWKTHERDDICAVGKSESESAVSTRGKRLPGHLVKGCMGIKTSVWESGRRSGCRGQEDQSINDLGCQARSWNH